MYICVYIYIYIYIYIYAPLRRLGERPEARRAGRPRPTDVCNASFVFLYSCYFLDSFDFFLFHEADRTITKYKSTQTAPLTTHSMQRCCGLSIALRFFTVR